MKKSMPLLLAFAFVSSAASATSILPGSVPAGHAKLICKPEILVTGRDTGRRVCATYAEWRHFRLMRSRARQETAPMIDFVLSPDRSAYTPPVR
jgi:hypothetical protein